MKHDLLDDFQLKKVQLIGKGGFGEVWKAVNNEGEFFALKIFIEDTKDYDEDKFKRFSNMVEEYWNLSNLKPSTLERFLE